jgi:glucosamine--fructose-6-phosphate aminotransferase (isomerizing)
MCGIVGYISKNKNSNSLRLGLEALKRLEYRGYDSAGFAVWDNKQKDIFFQKAVGRIIKLEEKLNDNNFNFGNPIILHTRWATHGEVTEKNAHPHFDCQKNIYLVHNGIIENYKQLKEQLIKEGHKFISETDTEVLTHLIEKYFKGNLELAVKKALMDVRGTYGIAVISRDDPCKIVAARLGSPLLIGIGDDEYLVASDPTAIITRTRQIINLNDNEIVVLEPDNFFITQAKAISISKGIIEKPVEKIEWTIEEAEKGGFAHFMLKEIMEQPESIKNSLRGRLILEQGKAKLGGLETVSEKIREINKIKIVACGSAYYAGLAAKYIIEEYAGISCEVDLASEFRYRKPVLDKKTLVLAVSQSGETADTLGAIKEAKEKGVMVLGIVNTVGSSIARETEAGVYNHAGPEIGVASTKAFTSQLTVLALFSLFLGRQRQLSLVMGQRIAKELSRIPELVKKVLENDSKIKALAQKYKDFNNFLYLGRKYNFPIALEGALKLKEISYIHAEGYSTGEMKHGPIALIDENFPSFIIAVSDSVYEKVVSNIEEIKARKGPVIVLATEGNNEIKEIVDDVIYIPKTLEMLSPIISIIPLQLFAYYMSVLKGYDPDFPRNLAKAVTVE